MSITLDPYNAEREALFSLAAPPGREPFRGQRVLEVGCGDGRLTWRYAAEAAAVCAIDPDPDKIVQARAEMPVGLGEQVTFEAAAIEDFVAPYPFDLVIFSWSL
jgi:2-polyprenyl-3-methyl-5-hydroxy-6-metoxy-1,4-benzoquinol methylase